jgi:hypothetical protein
MHVTSPSCTTGVIFSVVAATTVSAGLTSPFLTAALYFFFSLLYHRLISLHLPASLVVWLTDVNQSYSIYMMSREAKKDQYHIARNQSSRRSHASRDVIAEQQHPTPLAMTSTHPAGTSRTYMIRQKESKGNAHDKQNRHGRKFQSPSRKEILKDNEIIGFDRFSRRSIKKGQLQ